MICRNDLDRARLGRACLLLVPLTGLTACASAPTMQTAPDAPPPHIPYETRPGDAANVQRVLESIEGHPHGSAPAASRAPARAQGPAQEDAPVALTLENRSDCHLGFYLKGPVVRQLALPPGQTIPLAIAPGAYSFAFDTAHCAGHLPPLSGKDVFQSGSSYTLTVAQDSVARAGGELLVRNDTGGSLRLDVGDVHRTLGVGSSSIALAPGAYSAHASGPCGSRTDRFEIAVGGSYTSS